jgi:hypothetical protein
MYNRERGNSNNKYVGLFFCLRKLLYLQNAVSVVYIIKKDLLIIAVVERCG